VRRDDLASHHRSSSFQDFQELICLDIVASLQLVGITLSMLIGTALRLHNLSTLSTGLVIRRSGGSLSDRVQVMDSRPFHLGL
jgi:hypothetical protein